MISIDTGFSPDEMYRLLYTPFEKGVAIGYSIGYSI